MKCTILGWNWIYPRFDTVMKKGCTRVQNEARRGNIWDFAARRSEARRKASAARRSDSAKSCLVSDSGVYAVDDSVYILYDINFSWFRWYLLHLIWNKWKTWLLVSVNKKPCASYQKSRLRQDVNEQNQLVYLISCATHWLERNEISCFSANVLLIAFLLCNYFRYFLNLSFITTQ